MNDDAVRFNGTAEQLSALAKVLCRQLQSEARAKALILREKDHTSQAFRTALGVWLAYRACPPVRILEAGPPLVIGVYDGSSHATVVLNGHRLEITGDEPARAIGDRIQKMALEKKGGRPRVQEHPDEWADTRESTQRIMGAIERGTLVDVACKQENTPRSTYYANRDRLLKEEEESS